MEKASSAKATARIITCSFLITAAFKNKIRQFQEIFSVWAQKSAGDICFGLSSAQNHLNTQHSMKWASESYPSLTQPRMSIPYKATEQANILWLLQNLFIPRIRPTLLSVISKTKSRHHDIADSIAQLFIYLSYPEDFFKLLFQKL